MNTPRRKTTLLALVGSVALASAAYGIGTQTGGGESGAASSQGSRPVRTMGMRWRDRVESLAGRLGVSEARLRAAFEAIRKSEQQSGADPRSQFEKALADALGLPQSKVHDALAKLQAQEQAAESGRRDAFAKALASALGLDHAKVKGALDALRPNPGGPPPGGRLRPFGPPGGPGDFLDALASKLGVDRNKLRAALEKVRPAGPMGGPHPFAGPPGGHRGLRFFHRGGPPGGGPPRPGFGARRFRIGPPPAFAGDLAKALGVRSADVTAALEKVRSQLESQMHARRDKLATDLANQLGIPVQKVKDAFAAGPGEEP